MEGYLSMAEAVNAKRTQSPINEAQMASCETKHTIFSFILATIQITRCNRPEKFDPVSCLV